MCLVTVFAREDIIKCTVTFVPAYSDAIVVIAWSETANWQEMQLGVGEYRLKTTTMLY